MVLQTTNQRFYFCRHSDGVFVETVLLLLYLDDAGADPWGDPRETEAFIREPLTSGCRPTDRQDLQSVGHCASCSHPPREC